MRIIVTDPTRKRNKDFCFDRREHRESRRSKTRCFVLPRHLKFSFRILSRRRYTPTNVPRSTKIKLLLHWFGSQMRLYCFAPGFRLARYARYGLVEKVSDSISGYKAEFTRTIFKWQIYLMIVKMTQQVFVSSPKFSAPVLTLDIRDTHRDTRTQCHIC